MLTELYLLRPRLAVREIQEDLLYPCGVISRVMSLMTTFVHALATFYSHELHVDRHSPIDVQFSSLKGVNASKTDHIEQNGIGIGYLRRV